METFYHALKVAPGTCIGCTHCMSLCPTRAIRVMRGMAVIDKNACVDCGMCLKSCPRQAIYVAQDDFNQIFQYKYRVVILPTVLFGQFAEEVTEDQIFAELHDMGFTHVIEAAQAYGVLAKATRRYMQKHAYLRPFISAFCPAIVRLIQVRFPALLEHILPLKQGMDLAAIYARRKFTAEGVAPGDIGIFYVTPCAAKIAAIKSPVGEDRSDVDGVINLDFLYNKIQLGLSRHRDNPLPPVPEQTYLSPDAIAWTLSEGEASNFEGRCLAIDGIHNVSDILEKIENDELLDIDYLELRACSHSCPGGTLTVNNRFLTIERLRKRMQGVTDNPRTCPNDIAGDEEYLIANGRLHEEIPPRSIDQLDENFVTAMQKMEKINRIMEVLPRIDCGACGTPSCHTLARDVVQGKAKLSQCVFMQKLLCRESLMTAEESMELSEQTWGEKRFEQ